jgi:hypothetical protein
MLLFILDDGQKLHILKQFLKLDKIFYNIWTPLKVCVGNIISTIEASSIL